MMPLCPPAHAQRSCKRNPLGPISTKEQEIINNKKLNTTLKAFEDREANFSHLLLESEKLRIGSQEESQEDVEMTVSEEPSEHQPMEEEEREEELTDKSGPAKGRKRRDKKHHSSGERMTVLDGTRYYDREGNIPQYWKNPDGCPTGSPAGVHLPQGDRHNMCLH